MVEGRFFVPKIESVLNILSLYEILKSQKWKANFPKGGAGSEKPIGRTAQATGDPAGGTGRSPGGLPPDHRLAGKRTVQSVHPAGVQISRYFGLPIEEIFLYEEDPDYGDTEKIVEFGMDWGISEKDVRQFIYDCVGHY